MRFWKRIKLLINVPGYGGRVGIFVFLGTMMLVVAPSVPDHDSKRIFTDFAVAFLAVGFVSILWDLAGGDPTEVRLKETHRHMTVLSDIVDSNLGIERIWPERAAWQSDSDDGLKIWQDRVLKAKDVDIVSNSFYNNWFKNKAFAKRFFESLESSKSIQIILLNPDSDIAKLRKEDEGESRPELQGEIKDTLAIIAQNRKVIKKADSRQPEATGVPEW